jgi:protein-L-isoaspartate(D-aspartate) O-methyltransferase
MSSAMPSDLTIGFSIDQCRRFYAEEIRTVANIESDSLAGAFARVVREQFLGLPPWHYYSGPSLVKPIYRTTENVCDLYHDVFVALQPGTFLNNGQPSLIARMISALNLTEGKRVMHIGAGTGYYSAIMGEVVGSKGSVTAVEIDRDLASQATANLAAYSQIAVLNMDGEAFEPGPMDAILVNAGVTHPHPRWLDCLQEAGVIVLPLCVGKSPQANDVLVIRITRKHDRFAAELLLLMTMYTSTSLRDPDRQALLNASLESHAITRLRSVQRRDHAQAESCIVHIPGFCLSADAP